MPAVIVGRNVVLRASEVALAAALQGRGRLVVITGEAGIGKTTMARAIAERAETAGAFVRWGGCWSGDDVMPFGVWIDCLRRPGGDACAAAAARLEEGEFEAGVDGAARGRSRFYAAVTDALASSAAVRPQVVVLEDLHWADVPSLHLLAAVAARLPAMSVLVVATYRDDELPPGGPLAAIGGNAERITLEGLTKDDVALLLTEVLGVNPSRDETLSVHRDTGGNPLFVTEVGRLIAAGSSATVPSGAREILARRLARLSPACHRVLGAAAVLGVTFAAETLAGVLGDTADEVAAAIDEAAGMRLVVADGDEGRWSFAHALFLATRYEALGSIERSELHRRAVEVLSGSPSVAAGVLAHHAVRGRFEPGDPRPAELVVAAARDAVARLASEEAILLAERALDLAPAGPAGNEVRAAAWLVAGDAQLRRGDAGAAAADFESAASIGRALGRGDLVARAALGFAAGLGGFEVRLFDQRQLDLLEEAAVAVPEDAALRPLVLARLSVALSFAGSEARRLALAQEAVDGARRSGDGRALAAAIAARCDAMAGPDHVAERLGAASEIIGLAQRRGDLPLELLGRRLRVVALLELRDLEALHAELAAFARAADRLGDPLYGWYVPMWKAMLSYADGRIDDALRLAGDAGELGRSAGSTNAELLRQTMELFASIDRRDADAADAAWTEMLSIHPELLSLVAAPALALIDAACGRADRARAFLDRSGRETLVGFAKDQEWLTSVAQLLLAAVRTGHDEVVRDAYQRLLPYTGLGVFEGVAAVDHGVVDRFLALAAGHLGDIEAASAHVDAALTGTVGAGRLVLAHTRADCARALAGGDQPDRHRGADLAASAIAEYDGLGLTRLADEVRALPAPPTQREDVEANRSAVLERDGDTWVFTFDGSTARIRHAKGVADLAVLLARPGRDVHVRELAGVAHLRGPVGADPALDDTAVEQYRRRLRDLEDELDEASRQADDGRTEKLGAERDALVEELTRSFGLGGRRRRTGPDPDERLRKAVQARLKATIERLDGLHAPLAGHLRSAVRTGFLCSYEPETPITWRVVANRSR
ncbi:MAG: AAA family ATPase [Actinomycetota bacterium]|nr:AAA family ATPase [Actinomycetota bacterium]